MRSRATPTSAPTNSPGLVDQRSVQPGERLALDAVDALVVAPQGEDTAEEERQDSAAEQLRVRRLPVGRPEVPSAFRREKIPVEDEVDPRVVAAQVDPVDHRGGKA